LKAKAVASAREDAPILANSSPSLRVTACSSMPISAAISRLVLPWTRLRSSCASWDSAPSPSPPPSPSPWSSAAAGTFSMPALGALAPELATNDEQLGHANAVRATLDSLAGVIGPAFAGILIVVGGLPIAFVLNGLSFAVVVLAMVVSRPMSRPDPSSSSSAVTGRDRTEDRKSVV
jgi:Major Facilitator Superfamily.